MSEEGGTVVDKRGLRRKVHVNDFVRGARAAWDDDSNAVGCSASALHAYLALDRGWAETLGVLREASAGSGKRRRW